MYRNKVPHIALNNAVAAELDEARVKRGVTQQELAELSGIPRVSIQRYLAGTRPINMDELAILADALGEDPTDLFARAVARVKRDD